MEVVCFPPRPEGEAGLRNANGALCDAGFFVTTVPTTILEQVRAGASGFTRTLPDVFFAKDGADFSNGVVLPYGSDSAMMTAKFEGFSGDDKAVKESGVVREHPGRERASPCSRSAKPHASPSNAEHICYQKGAGAITTS